MRQTELFAAEPELPDGFAYEREFISPREEQALLCELEQLNFAEVKMHGVVAKRRVVHFGHGYHFDSRQLAAGPAIPAFLLPLRERVAKFAGRKPDEFAEVLVTEYPEGAAIGWHRDAPAFEIVVGVSLLNECTMKFRPWPPEKNAPQRSRPLAHVLEPRSIYVLRGASRTRWQHHIPPMKTRRFSITFRTLRERH